jgi:lauroyl/myristoyl acyltransferase
MATDNDGMRDRPNGPNPAGGSRGARQKRDDWNRLVVVADIAALLGVAGMAPISWLTPPKAWRFMATVFAPIAARLALSAEENTREIEALAGDRLAGRTAKDVQLDAFAAFIEGNLQLLRDYRPGGWNPHIELFGQEGIDGGLSEGRGVILWMSFFTAYSLVAKIALHQAGYSVSHLSHPKHGYSNTRFARRFLNPIRTTVEQRYLYERVVLSQDSSIAALRVLQERLESNGVVSITATPQGQKPVATRFLAGEFLLAGGAPTLASLTGAALLPVFPIQTGANEFRVTIGTRIEIPDRSVTAVETAVNEYAAQLEKYVLEYPGQWRGWHTL